MKTSPHRQDVTFTNSRGEAFHVSVFPPRGTPTPTEEPPPVLFCVHGAGMSGDNFYRLADYLQKEGRGFNASAAPAVVANTSEPPPPSSAVAVGAPGRPVVAPRLPPTAPAGGGRTGPHEVFARPAMPPVPSSKGPGSATAMEGPAGDCAFMPPPPDTSSDEIAMAVVTFDLRCHGESTFNGGEDSLTLSVLTQDFCDVLQYAKTTLFPASDFFVLGHSLGGSIVAQGLTSPAAQSRIAGVVLVDVVEGTAKMSLKYMHDFLEKRPASFAAVKDAETWFLHHGGMRSPDGAAVSVPPLLKQDPASGRYVWRSNLSKMESVWDGWFDGLDKAFVGLPFPKMLCLANAERLDTELTVAQMQGKFQFEIVGNNCGHYIMDDATVLLGSKVMRFVKRIETLTKKLKTGIKPGMPLHLNNTTVPASRQGM